MPEERSLRQVYRSITAQRATASPGVSGDEDIMRAAVAVMRESRGLTAVPAMPAVLKSAHHRARTDELARQLAADPLLADLLSSDDDALGQIYQALNAPKLEAAYRATAREGRKFADREISAVTQLFTPRWVVEFLLERTLGRLWREMHPDTRVPLPWLADCMSDASRATVKPVRELRLLDPACGTMNFGLATIDLLRGMYREELDRAGRRGWPAEPSVARESEIDQAIVANNLFGIDIDPSALDLARASIAIKLRKAPSEVARAQLAARDALFGALPRGWPTSFDIVVTNPPYLSARNLSRDIVERMKRRYPAGWRDQCACFVERCVELADEQNGRVGILAMQSFMFTAGFENLRERLAGTVAVEAVAHFGGGLFDIGNPGTLQTAAIAMRRETSESRIAAQHVTAFRLVDARDKRAALAAAVQKVARGSSTRGRSGTGRIELSQADLTSGPRRAWCYWLGAAQRRAFTMLPKLGQTAPPRQGLATTDNDRFVRFWWEVTPTSQAAPCRASPLTWFHYVKSGRFRRWYEAPMHRVNWRDDGAEIKAEIVRRYPYLRGEWQWVAKNSQHYFKSGVTYSYLTSGRFSARRLDAGAIFDVAGSSLFPEDPLGMLAILNSSAAARLLAAINPTVNYQVGDLRELPIPRIAEDDARAVEIRRNVGRLVDLTRYLDTFDETSPDFAAPMPLHAAEQIWRDTRREVGEIEASIDRRVSELFDFTHDALPDAAAESFYGSELARRWVGFALRPVLAARGTVQLTPMTARLLKDVRASIDSLAGAGSVGRVERLLPQGGIERFLSRDLVPWHVALYRRRPVWWPLGDAARCFIVAHDYATSDLIASVLRRLGATLPRGWQRNLDYGIAANLVALLEHVPHAPLRRALVRRARDSQENRAEAAYA